MAGRRKKTSHSSGMYRKRITLGHDENGKPIIKAVYANTKEELENKIAQLRIDKGMGIAVTDDKSTWKYWADTWEKIALPPLRKTTKDMYYAALKHLSPLNSKKVSKLSPIDLSIIISNMNNNNYSKRTINSVISTARQICKLARKNKAMMYDITEDIKAPAEAPVTEREALTIEEQKALLSVKPLPFKGIADEKRANRLPLIKMLALMFYYCGLRKEEAVVLEWKNVDFSSRTLSVTNAYAFKEKKIKSTKSKAGERQIPIPQIYAKMLKKWKNINDSTPLGRKYVFCGNHGIIQGGEFDRLWDTLLDAISGITICDRISAGRKTKGIKPNTQQKYYFTAHQLRHTYATNCIAKGIDVRTVQYLMGHATAEMTMRYSHLSPTALLEARNILDGSSTNQ